MNPAIRLELYSSREIIYLQSLLHFLGKLKSYGESFQKLPTLRMWEYEGLTGKRTSL